MENKLKKIVGNIEKRISGKPDIGIIAAKGLGELIDGLEDRVSISFEDAGLELLGGDKGAFYWGRLGNKNVVVAYGRLHSYNGYAAHEAVLPVFILEKLGCKTLMLSCAGGAIGCRMKVGDIVATANHINLSGENPLYGIQSEIYGERFIDLTDAYSPRLIEIAKKCGKELGIKVKTGVLVELKGPTGETVAEVKGAKRLGGSVLGFHMVKEVIAARYAGMEVFASSVITNYASGLSEAGIDRSAIDHNRKIAEKDNSKLFINIINNI